MYAYMPVHCPICRSEFDGMKAYGRLANCCSKDCCDEWEWRKTLAIMGKAYYAKRAVSNQHPTKPAPLL